MMELSKTISKTAKGTTFTPIDFNTRVSLFKIPSLASVFSRTKMETSTMENSRMASMKAEENIKIKIRIIFMMGSG
jgi:hypothetical protein